MWSLAACDTLLKREDRSPKNPLRSGVSTGTATATATATPSPLANAAPQPTAIATPAPVVLPPQPPTVSVPAQQDQVKVGLILGPGGMKAFAHLGVLREMNRARVPVHAIVGLEWGAVMAGLYSMQGQINDTEWKAFKLRDSELPSSSLLSARIKAQPINSLQTFFEGAFGNALMEKAKIDFACPAGNSRGDRAAWFNRGSYRDAMSKCVPYAPMYLENNGYLASPFSVDDAVIWLRSRGANVILLVNVLGQGEVFSAKMVGEHPTENVLWGEVRREMLRAKSPSVHYVINVNTSGHPITDYEGRRALMDAGQKAATEIVNKMVSQYGF